MTESPRTFLPPDEGLAVSVSVLLVFAPSRGVPHTTHTGGQSCLSLTPALVLKVEEEAAQGQGKKRVQDKVVRRAVGSRSPETHRP